MSGRAILRRSLRGCGHMPHVGNHPGTGYVIALIGAGAFAGLRGGWLGAIAGACFVACVMVPMYLYGAYERAKLSEKISAGRDAA